MLAKFAGNPAAVRTVENMVKVIEKEDGQARRIRVTDRGMVSEDRIDFLRTPEPTTPETRKALMISKAVFGSV